MRRMPLPAGYLLAAILLISGCATAPVNDPATLVTNCAENIARAKARPAPSRTARLNCFITSRSARMNIYVRDYSQSAVHFEMAKTVEEQLYGISVSEAGTSFLINVCHARIQGSEFRTGFICTFTMQ